jgi:MoaA/NifB/PqqE/SkfB family radical SAM enzyme
MTKGDILSIETGYSCNALCGFCPQVTFRERAVEKPRQLDLTTEEIKQRISQGAEDGYAQLGFSGGEPTIRPDFIELVEYAREQGFSRIALTTNGVRFAYLQYTKKVIDAGLTNINISVHGATAKTHNAMMRMPNAFEHAIEGIQNIGKVSQLLQRRIDMMSMCLGAPQVLSEFPEHVRLMGSLGIRLHMIQPFIMNQGNSNFSERAISPYQELARAIRAGTKVAKGHNGHIKLFNTPICLFWDIEEDLERQIGRLDVIKTHHESGGNVSNQWSTPGYYRVNECKTCNEACNGFRTEYYPQSEMVETIKTAVSRHLEIEGDIDVWIGGLEYLTRESMEDITRFIKEKGAKRLTLVTSAFGRAQTGQFSRKALQYIDEVSFILREGKEDKLLDLTQFGNFRDIEKVVGLVRQSPSTSVSAMVTGDSLAQLVDSEIVDFISRTNFDAVRLFYRFSFRNWSLLALKGKRLSIIRQLKSVCKRVVLGRPIRLFFARGVVFEKPEISYVDHPWINNPNPELLAIPDRFWFILDWKKKVEAVSKGVVSRIPKAIFSGGVWGSASFFLATASISRGGISPAIPWVVVVLWLALWTSRRIGVTSGVLVGALVGVAAQSGTENCLALASIVGVMSALLCCRIEWPEIEPLTRIRDEHNTRPRKYVLWGGVPD